MIKEHKTFTPKLVSKEKDKDMPEALFKDIESYAKEAFDNKFTDEKVKFLILLQEIADYVKKKLEERNERDVCWHVVVGRHFGGYVTYREKMYAYFYIGQMGFLIFATVNFYF